MHIFCNWAWLYWRQLPSATNTACQPRTVNPLNAELNPIWHLLALLRAHHILHVGGLRVNAPTHPARAKFLPHIFYARVRCRECLNLLGAFAIFRKSTISFIMSVRPPVRVEQLGSHRTDFHGIWYLRIFKKYAGKIQIPFILVKNNGYSQCTTTEC